MRSLPSVLRSLTGMPLRRPEPASAFPPDTLATYGGDGILASPHRLELDRIEALVRRYRGRPARIENPFAAFPTRSFWLGRLMDDED